MSGFFFDNFKKYLLEEGGKEMSKVHFDEKDTSQTTIKDMCIGDWFKCANDIYILLSLDVDGDYQCYNITEEELYTFDERRYGCFADKLKNITVKYEI